MYISLRDLTHNQARMYDVLINLNSRQQQLFEIIKSLATEQYCSSKNVGWVEKRNPTFIGFCWVFLK
jgi:hypothetical protein